jgi:hypothetical protein
VVQQNKQLQQSSKRSLFSPQLNLLEPSTLTSTLSSISHVRNTQEIINDIRTEPICAPAELCIAHSVVLTDCALITAKVYH